MATVHVVMPEGVDDPTRPSGGNVYDRRVCGGLADLGWTVREHPVPGCWPHPDAAALAALAAAVRTVPDGGVALVDGLVASPAPRVLVREAGRIRLVVLVHMPLGAPAGRYRPPAASPVTAAEAAVLRAAAEVVATSEWTRRWLLGRYGLSPGRVRVATPGVDPAAPAPATPAGGELLCVGAVTPLKGHDVLLRALASIRDRSWRCRCVGALDRDPGYVARLREQARADGVGERVRFCGPRAGAALAAAYAATDLVVLASRAETYGMVVTEALARAVPVVATDVGGVREALGRAPQGAVPGLLVPGEHPGALAAALSRWLDDASLRGRLRRAARERRASLSGWSTTSLAVSRALQPSGPVSVGRAGSPAGAPTAGPATG
jgi:glycosyltransferase involved in cell wall biosynthesis